MNTKSSTSISSKYFESEVCMDDIDNGDFILTGSENSTLTPDEIFGKYWMWSNRQWENVGIKFENKTKGMICNTWLKSEFEKEIEDNLTSDVLGYVGMFNFVNLIKREMKIHKLNMTKLSLVYDEISLKLCKLKKYYKVPNDRPSQMVRNWIKMWYCQTLYETTHDSKRARYKNHRIFKQIDSTFLCPSATVLLDVYRSEWLEHVGQSADDYTDWEGKRCG